MNEKIFNAINDPNVTFFIFPTPKLKEMVIQNQHPHVLAMSSWVKAAILEGKVLPVSKEDVMNFINQNLPPPQQFLMSVGDVRVSGAVNIVVSENQSANKSTGV